MPTRSKVKTTNRKKATSKKRAPKKKTQPRRGRKHRRNPEPSFEWEHRPRGDLEDCYEVRVPYYKGVDLWGSVHRFRDSDPWFLQAKTIPSDTPQGEGSQAKGFPDHYGEESLFEEARGQVESFIQEKLKVFIKKKKTQDPESESEKIRKRGVEAKDPAIAEFFRSFKDEPSDSSEVFLEDILRRKDRGDIDYWPNPKKKRKPKKKTKAKKKRSQKRRARKNPYGVEEFRTDLDDGNYKIEYDNGDVIYFDENARLHRLGGPAAIYPDGHKEYWIHGQRFYDEESYESASRPESSGKPTITPLPNGGRKIVGPDGSIVYENASGKRHREDGPAVIWPDGGKEYWLNGKRHREDGPAVIWPDGGKEYWLNGEHHREGGPAVVEPDGTEEYWLNGKRHREGGPAIVRPDGTKEYWIHGKAHREGGPAVVEPDGTEEYWLNGKRHREDGPAIVRPGGYNSYLLDDVEYTEEDWKEEMRRRRGDVIEPEPEPDPVGDSAKLAEWELQKKRMDKRSQEILGSDLPELLYEYPGDVDLWEKYKDPLDNPKKKRRRKKKRTSARKKTTARDLIAACRKHWDTYCEKPNKTNLKKVFKHLEKMAESTAKTVKDERRKCLRVAKLEAKELKLKI